MGSEKESLLGRLAVERGFITQEQLDEVLANQRTMREEMGIDQPIAEILLGKGWLSGDKVKELTKAVAAETGAVRFVGGYEIVARLGSGGMGAVYKARNVGSGRLVALKVLPPSLATESLITRFKREARITSKLESDNIVGCVEFGFDEKRKCHFCALEFIEGEVLRTRIKRVGRLPEREAVGIARQIARGLEHAHLNGLVHRDVKPANVMITPDGKAKLLDLGLARATDSQDVRLTQSGTFVGSAYYASPEQATGKDDIDIRADVYSLGATLYHMVTGKPPFDGERMMTVLQKQISDTVKWPADTSADVSEGLSWVIAKMMAKAPDERYETPGDVVADLDLVAEGAEPTAARKPPGKSTVAHPRQRRSARSRPGRRAAGAARGGARQPHGEAPQERSKMPWAVVGGALAGLAVLGIVFASRRPRRRPTRAPPTAPSVAVVSEPEKGPTPAEPAPTPPPPVVEIPAREPEPPEPPEPLDLPEPPAPVIPEVAVPGPTPVTMPVAPPPVTDPPPAVGTLDQGLVGHWKFDETDGLTAQDSSGKGALGTITGTARAAGKLGGALGFDGSDDRIQFGARDVDPPWSLGVWVKREPGPKRVTTLMNSARFSLRLKQIGTTDKLGFTRYGVKDYVFDAAAPVGVWCHITFVGTAEGTSVYVDGVKRASHPATISMPMRGFGRGSDHSPKALIDDIRAYNRALTGDEIRVLATGRAPAPPREITRGLVGHWKFDEGEGPTARDSSVNANHLTLEGARWSAGRTGGALSFGEGQALAAVESPRGLPSGDAPKTIAAWFKARALAGLQNIGGFGNNAHGENFQVGVAGGRFVVWGWWIGKDWNTKVDTTPYGDGEWHHVAVSYEARTTKLYLDGDEKASTQKFIYGAKPQRVVIGNEVDKLGHMFRGAVDEFRIYDRVLAPEEVAVLAGVRPPAGGAPTRGLLAHWSFDEGEGRTAGDSSGKGNNGLLQNDPTWATGKLGGALSFNGVNSYVGVRPPPGLTGSAITVSAWVNYAEVPTREWSNVVIAQDDNRSRVFQLVAHRGRLCWHRFGKGQDIVARQPVQPGTWQHVAATFDGTKHRLYLDGELEAEAPGTLRLDPDLHVRIGMKGSGEFAFKGLIDDVRMYDRALSQADVKALFEGRSAPVPPQFDLTRGLAGHWKLDEGRGVSVRDSSGQRKHGKIRGGKWAKGKVGAALEFDGTNDYVGVRDSPDVGGGSFSVTAWIYRKDGVERKFVSKWNDNARTLQFDCQVYTDAKLWFEVEQPNGRSKVARGSTVIQKDMWYHFAGVADAATSQMTIYLNGVKEPLQRAPDWDGTVRSVQMELNIGRKASGNHYWSGLIDDVRIYKRALSQAEAKALFEGRTGPVPPGGPVEPTKPAWLLVEADEFLMKGDHAGAEAWLVKAAGDDKYAEATDEIAAALGVAGALAAHHKAAVAGAEARVGKQTELAGRTGRPRKGEVKSVTEKGIDLVTKFAIVAGGKRIEREKRVTVVWAELALDQVDELARAGGWKGAGADAAVARAYLALGRKKADLAGKALAGAADHPLAAHLGDLIEGARKPAEKAAPKTGVVAKPRPTVPTPGLVGWWRFDELKGTAAKDHSGKGNHGTIKGATWVRGRTGGALSFSDPGHYVEIADHPALDLTQQFTIATWVSWRAPGGRRSTILAKALAGRVGNYAIRPRRGSTGFGFLWDNVGAKGTYSTIELTRNAWNLIVVTADAAHPTEPWMKIYVDGAEAATYAAPKFRTSRRPRANDDPLYIGGMPNETSDCNFNGLIDDVLIYNRVLSTAEMRSLLGASAPRQPPRVTTTAPVMAAAGSAYSYKIEASGNPAPKLTVKGLPKWLKFDGTDTISGTPGKGDIGSTASIIIKADNGVGLVNTQRLRIKVLKVDPGLAGWWKFDEVTGAIARDSSGRGNHAKITGGARVRGRAGNALRFDGNDDYVELPSAATSGLKTFTFSLWVKTTEKRSRERHWHRPCLIGQATQGVPSGDLSINTSNGYVGMFHGLYPRGDKTYLSATRRVNDGTWHHIALANDGESAMLYVDGEREAALPSGLALNNTAFRVGAQGGTDESGFHHSGVIDDVRVYNRALSAAEIAALAGSARAARAAPAAAAPVVEPNKPNVISFPTAKARFVRFAITKSYSGAPGIDELEVFGPAGGPNLALAKNGAVATASSCIRGYAIHKIAHLNDGLYGNSHSWIALGSREEWAQVKLPRIAGVAKVVFSRDRNGRGRDRIPIDFAIQLSLDGKRWKTVREVKATVAPRALGP